jgi:hypothetical protein
VAIASPLPLPVSDVGRPVLVTTSILITIPIGQSVVADTVTAPACPDDTSFLATDLQAAPIINSSTAATNAASLPRWAVSLQVIQRHSSGLFSPWLMVYGNGPAQGSTSIPGGQPLPDTNLSNVIVSFVGGNVVAFTTTMVIHVTGYCGVPFVRP